MMNGRVGCGGVSRGNEEDGINIKVALF